MFTAMCYTFIDHAIAGGTPILGYGNMLIAKSEKIPKRKLACEVKKGGLHVGYLLKRYHNSGSFAQFYSIFFCPIRAKRGEGQDGKSPSSLLFEPISPSSLNFHLPTAL